MLNTATLPVIDSVLMDESPEDAAVLRPILMQLRTAADREPPVPSAAVQRLLDGNVPGKVVRMGDFLARRESKGQGQYGMKRRLAVTSMAAVLMLGAGTGVAAAVDGDFRTVISRDVAQVGTVLAPHAAPVSPAAAEAAAVTPSASAEAAPAPVVAAPAPAAPAAAPVAPEAPVAAPAPVEAPAAPVAAATVDGPGKSEDSQGARGDKAATAGAAAAAAGRDGQDALHGRGVAGGSGNGNSQGEESGNSHGHGKDVAAAKKAAPQLPHADALEELLAKVKKARDR